MFDLNEEKRELLIDAVDGFLKDIGASDATRKLCKTLYNTAFPPMPPPAFPVVFPVPTVRQAWAKEEKPIGSVYLNVASLFASAVEIRVLNRSASVLVEDDRGEEWTLAGETGQDFLRYAASTGMFDQDPDPPAAVVEQVTARKKASADFQAAMALRHGHVPGTEDLERMFSAEPLSGPVIDPRTVDDLNDDPPTRAELPPAAEDPDEASLS